MFGKIEIVDAEDARYLLLSGQIQGGSFHHPSAQSTVPGLRGVGAVAASSYMAGWLLAGAMHPAASVVCVGLGSGAGIIQLLACCPSVDVTVVEIDPVMVEVARKAFPLLQYYEMVGRLNIATADAKDYLDSEDMFDVGLADAYDGTSYNIKDSYMPALFSRCKHVYANVIDAITGQSTRHLLELAHKFDKPIKYRLHATVDQPIESAQYQPANWIMTTDNLNPLLLDQLHPFNELPDCAAIEYANQSYAHLTSQVA